MSRRSRLGRSFVVAARASQIKEIDYGKFENPPHVHGWDARRDLRRLGEAYMVAMGTYYPDECGKTFEITFDTGEKILVVVGDIKADCHTDKTNRYSPVYDNNGNFISANVLEFIVDTDALSRYTKRLGTVEYCGNLQGNIVSIVAIKEGVQEI